MREPEGTCPRGWAQPASIFLQKSAPRRHERKCWKDTPNSAGSPAESSFRVWGEVHLEVKQTTATWVFYHQVLGSSQAPAGWIFPPKGPWDQTPAGEGSVTFPGPISSGGQWGRARPANLSPELHPLSVPRRTNALKWSLPLPFAWQRHSHHHMRDKIHRAQVAVYVTSGSLHAKKGPLLPQNCFHLAVISGVFPSVWQILERRVPMGDAWVDFLNAVDGYVTSSSSLCQIYHVER